MGESTGRSYEAVKRCLWSSRGSEGLDRIFTVVGLDSFTDGLRNVNIIQGQPPELSTSPHEVLLDEGAATFLGWNVGQTHTVFLNGAEHEITIVGVTRGELARTMYFMRAELGEILGVNATSIYLTLPDGVDVDSSLAEVSIGVVERKTLIEGMNSLIDQQTQIFLAMMYLAHVTIAVMFNTMIMNVAERDFELATLRVLGASTPSLGIMLLFESLLIGIIGGLVGVVFAYGGAVGLAASFYLAVLVTS